MERTKVEISLPPISVIVAAYNEQAFIETTIASILESGFPCEVVVVDDGSTDETPKSSRNLLGKSRSSLTPPTRAKGLLSPQG